MTSEKLQPGPWLLTHFSHEEYTQTNTHTLSTNNLNVKLHLQPINRRVQTNKMDESVGDNNHTSMSLDTCWGIMDDALIEWMDGLMEKR